MKYLVYYNSKSHGEKFGQKFKRRWFVADPSKNPAGNGKPQWTYTKSEARELSGKQVEVVIGMATIACGYSGLKQVAV